MTQDTIEIRGLRIPTHVGWTDAELARQQVVSIDLSLHADLSKAALSDDLADTIDYDALIREVVELVGSSRARLLEHLGEEIANSISHNRLVDRVTVEIHKVELELPGVDFGGVSVRIERTFS
jgi:FolB domain-containing protein